MSPPNQHSMVLHCQHDFAAPGHFGPLWEQFRALGGAASDGGRLTRITHVAKSVLCSTAAQEHEPLLPKLSFARKLGPGSSSQVHQGASQFGEERGGLGQVYDL